MSEASDVLSRLTVAVEQLLQAAPEFRLSLEQYSQCKAAARTRA
jgi:hypothetical protein